MSESLRSGYLDATSLAVVATQTRFLMGASRPQPSVVHSQGQGEVEVEVEIRLRQAVEANRNIPKRARAFTALILPYIYFRFKSREIWINHVGMHGLLISTNASKQETSLGLSPGLTVSRLANGNVSHRSGESQPTVSDKS